MERIDVKQAVKAAIDFLRTIEAGAAYEDVAVEEVELSDDERIWLITLGYNPPGSSIARFSRESIERNYRIFRVDAASGEVISMKIREV